MTQATVCYRTKKLKFKFAGHVARDKWENGTVGLLLGFPIIGREGEGDSHQICLDEIVKAVGPNWASVTKNSRKRNG